MRKHKDFEYFTYDVGRYFPYRFEDNKEFVPYKEDNSELHWYVFVEDINAKKIIPVNIFEYNWVFLRDGLLYAKKHYSNNFIEFADHIRSWLSHEYWSRCEYETVISGWPPQSLNEKDLKELMNQLEEEKKHSSYPEYARVYPNIGTSYKIDVYTQVMMNWDRFIEYIWNNKKLITEKKLGLK